MSSSPEILKSSFERLIRKTDGEISVMCHDLSENESVFAVSPDMQMVSASVIKVPLMLYALEQVKQGKLSLDEPIEVEGPDILEDTQCFDSGPRQAVLQELLTWMIILSDNTSTNVLIKRFGFDDVNRYFSGMGWKKTRLERKMLDFDAVKEGRNNYTSAFDMYLLFKQLCCGEILDERLRFLAQSILCRQRSKEKLARYLWQEDVIFAHKTGGLDYLSHDVGVFYYKDRKVYGSAFVQKCSHKDGEPQLLGEIGKLMIEYITSKGN